MAVDIDDGRRAAPGVVELALLFSRIGLTSFGGGLSAWLYRELVRDRGWIGEEEFLNGLALCQALPGVNVTNMAIWFGYRLRGVAGAAACLLGIVVPAGVVIVLVAEGIGALARFPVVPLALDGASAAACGLSVSMGVTVATRLPRRVAPVLVALATFVSAAVLHLPLLAIVLVAAPVGVAAEWVRLAREAAP